MSHTFGSDANPAVLVSAALTFILLFTIIYQVIRLMSLFSPASHWIAAFCIAALAMFGFHRAQSHWIVLPGVALSLTIVVLLAVMFVLLLLRRRRASRETRLRARDR
ncbi:MAG: hypothetical protein KA354_25100 [Phycisphaerae bacterium]|nr:hypothetical protein [Phycisphaerae bacterium]